MRIVVMGVSGCGKTTIGEKLAVALQATFIDADDLHPLANKDKMTNGIPLKDEDRWPWLESVGLALAAHNDIVIACSALKKSYREKLSGLAQNIQFIHLTGNRETLRERLLGRNGHFMPVELLESQLQELEPLDASELGTEIAIDQSVEIIIDECITFVRK